MYNFTKKLPTNKKSKGVNQDKYIIVHHTAGGTFEGNCNLLSSGSKQVSCHFVVGPKGETCKIGDPKDILWHAGVSSWKGLKDMNKYSMGIEVVSDGTNFTREQVIVTIRLIEYLMGVFAIPKENVLRHKDVANGRKIDVGENFYKSVGFKSWAEFQNDLKAG